LIEGINLRKEYSNKSKSYLAVDNVNIKVNEGEFLTIYGASGSGKSTLLNMLVGILKPTSGEVILNGKRLNDMKVKQISKLRNQDVGYILQGPSILCNFNIIDNVCMPFYLSKQKGKIKEKALELIEKVGLKGKEYEYPANLSGGEIRRATIARALINNPKIIIADEPTCNLDADNSKMILNLLLDLSKVGIICM